MGRRGLGRTWPNPAVGAVIVKDGVIVGRGWTQAGGRPHAEVEALRRAGDAARGATLYVTLEPCSHHGKSPPCADAVVAAGVAGVVSALEDPNPKVSGQGYARLRAAGITVEIGVGADEARHDHAGHIRRMRDGRPNVMLKLAVSADGKVGAAGRKPLAITGAETRGARPSAARAKRCDHGRHRHRARRRSAADLPPAGHGAGFAGTHRARQRVAPAAVVAAGADGRRNAGMGGLRGRTRRVPAEQALLAHGVEVLRVEERSAGRLDLAAVLKLIAARGITRLMVEGGPKVAASLVAADLVDEAVLFRSPKTVGAAGIDALEGLPLTALTQSPRLRRSLR